MWWIGVLIVSPFWGMVSTQLFLQAWLAFINSVIGIVGFIAGRTERKITTLSIGVGLLGAIFYSLLLRTGFWVLDILNYGYSNAENTVYWIFAAFSLLFMVPQVPGRIVNAWRHSMVPGSLEADIIARQLSQT